MNLYIMRHGIAVDRDPVSFPDDSRRPLTLKGEDRVRLIADAMRSLELSFDHILSSPHLRASQTAEIVVSALGAKDQLDFTDTLAPEGDPKALIRAVNQLKPAPENVLLVGHEPFLSQFIALLISGQPDAAIDLKKGGLARLELEGSLRHGKCAELVWLFAPKQLALLA
jgi:phosphohistidine phosphatase